MQNSKYDISKSTAPAMPRLGKGTECVRLLLSQVSKDMHEPMVPMLFPILGAQISEAKFRYPDLIWKELFGMMKKTSWTIHAVIKDSLRIFDYDPKKTSSITSLTGEKKFPSWKNKKNYLLRHLQNQTLTFLSSEVIEVKEVITPFGRS